MNYRLLWLLALGLAATLTMAARGLAPVDTADDTAVTEVAITVLPAEPSPTPTDCTPLPIEMTAEIVKDTEYSRFQKPCSLLK